MGKQRVFVAPNESDDNDENIEVEEISDDEEEDVEEDPEEEPNEEELFEGEESEGNSCEDEPNEEEVNEEESSEVEPEKGETCGDESNQGEEPFEYLSEEEEPDEEGSNGEEEPCEEGSNEEEEPSEDDLTEEPCEEDVEEDLTDSGDYKENQSSYYPSSSDRKRAAGGLEFNVQKKQKQGPDPTEAPYEEKPKEDQLNLNMSSSDRKREAEVLECNAQKKPKQNLGTCDALCVVDVQDDIFPENRESIVGSGKRKRHSRWDIVGDNGEKAAEKKESRWGSDETQLKLLGPLKLPDCVKGLVPEGDLDPEIRKLNERLDMINAKLVSREVVVAADFVGLIEQRNKIIADLIKRNPTFNPPSESKPVKLFKKLYVPVKEFPDYNFVGLILGPRGRTQKRMEKETGASILLRGKGSTRKLLALPHVDDHSEDLHVHIEADNQESLDAAVAMVEKILTPVEEGKNELKRNQLRELSELEARACDVCGSLVHLTSACPLTATSNEGQSKLGSGLFSPFIPPLAPAPAPVPAPAPAPAGPWASNPAVNFMSEIDEAKLFVKYIPQSVDEEKFTQLFSPFGQILEARLIKDRATGLSKGYGFVKYADPAFAAEAVARLHGLLIDGKNLLVQVSGRGLITQNAPQWYPPPPFYHPAAVVMNLGPPMAWPGYSGSVMMPACYGGFATSNGFVVQSPASFAPPLYQTPASSSSLASSSIASSDELAQFPGFLKSLDSPDAVDQISGQGLSNARFL